MVFWQRTAWERTASLVRYGLLEEGSSLYHGVPKDFLPIFVAVSISRYLFGDKKALVESQCWRRDLIKSRSWSEVQKASQSWDHGLRLSAGWSMGEGQ